MSVIGHISPVSTPTYRSTPPTLVNGQVGDLLLDVNGRLLVSGAGGSSDVLIGAVNEIAPATDTASSGLNGRLQRIAQRITSLIALVPAALTSSGNFKIAVQEDNTTVSSATVGSLASAATSAQLLASTATRKGLIIQNTDANPVYLKYGTTASATDFTVKILGGDGYWEMPKPIYTGRIDVIWSADGAGAAQYTEL